MSSLLRMKFIMPLLFSKNVWRTLPNHMHMTAPNWGNFIRQPDPPPYQDLQAVAVLHSFFFIFVSSRVCVSASLPAILLDVFRSSSSQTPGNYLKLAMNLPSIIFISSRILPYHSTPIAGLLSPPLHKQQRKKKHFLHMKFFLVK